MNKETVALTGAESAQQAMRWVRILTGLFFLPHVWSKINGFAGTVGFFEKAGFVPGELFVSVALVLELVAALTLVSGYFTKIGALLSVAVLAGAIYAQTVVNGLGWFWAGKGMEYLLFWMLLSVVIFVADWRRQPNLLR